MGPIPGGRSGMVTFQLMAPRTGRQRRHIPRRVLLLSVLFSGLVATAAGALFARRADRPGVVTAEDVFGGPKHGAEQQGAHDHGGSDPTPLPNVELSTFDQTTVALRTLTGKRPLVVNLWSSTCPPCLREMPAIERVHRRLADRVRFVGVDISEPQPAPALAFLAKLDITYEQLRDPLGTSLADLGVAGLPSTLFVTAGGSVVHSHFGAMDEDQLVELLADHLGVDASTGP